MNITPSQLNANSPTRNGVGRATVKATSTTLTFGQSVPVKGSHDVTPEEVRNFLERTVTPRFPDGYSVTHGQGVWKGASEDNFSVTVVYPTRPMNGEGSPTDVTIKLEEIRAAYKSRFAQNATFRTDTACQLSID